MRDGNKNKGLKEGRMKRGEREKADIWTGDRGTPRQTLRDRDRDLERQIQRLGQTHTHR